MDEDRILVVDDDPSWQALLRETIEGVEGPSVGRLAVHIAGAYDEAEALLDRQHFYLAFLDLRLREDGRDMEGKRLAQKIVGQGEGTSIVIATGHADVSTVITALKQWQVHDFILKDEWRPEKVVQLVLSGVPAARARYRNRYESAVDLLRGQEPIFMWVARVLELVDPPSQTVRPDRRLGDFLNALLRDLYPLLPPRSGPAVTDDPAQGLFTARYWSKALGQPIIIHFGRAATVEQATQGATPLRSLHDEPLSVAGAVSIASGVDFTAYTRA